MRRGAPGSWRLLGPGRAWERGPGTRNARLGSGSGGRSLQRLDSQGCRSPCACAAPEGKKRGEKLPAPGCVCRGLPGDTVAVVGDAGREWDPRPRQPPTGPGSARAPLRATSPCAAQGPGRAGGQETVEGWSLGWPRVLPFGEICAAVQREDRWGFLPPRVLRPHIWEPGFFTGSQVTLEVEELENRREGTRTDFVVTPSTHTHIYTSLDTLPACCGGWGFAQKG